MLWLVVLSLKLDTEDMQFATAREVTNFLTESVKFST